LPIGGVPLHHLLSLNSVARSAARGVRWLIMRLRSRVSICGIASIICMGLLLSGNSCAAKAVSSPAPRWDSSREEQDIGLANAIRACVVSIQDGPPTVIVFDLRGLLALFSEAHYKDGVLSGISHGHRYAIYFAGIGPCERFITKQNKLIITASKYPPLRGWIVDSASYLVNMIDETGRSWRIGLDSAYLAGGDEPKESELKQMLRKTRQCSP